MSVNLLDESPLLSVTTAYQTAYQAATSLATLATLGLPTWLQPVDQPDTVSKQFVLSYQPPQVPGTPLSAGVLPQIPGVPSTGSALIFDVVLATANAVPQRVAYTEVARQTIEQTAVGFHVNEFGLGPGRLEMDAIIVFQGVEYVQVDNFFSFLRQIKTNNPLGQMTAPGETLFLDVYLQRKLVITLETVMIEEVAGSNNQAHVVLSASILKDYSAPSAANVTQSGLPPSVSNLAAAAGLLGSEGALGFLGVSLP